MIEVHDLRKSYGETEALRGIDFRIRQGEVVGLLGPNGAGKTTIMKILVGYLLPNAGSAVVSGLDVTEQPLQVQRRIGYMPENAPLYGDMLVQDFLDFMGRVRGMEPAEIGLRLRAVVEECGIGDVLTRPIGHLSKGYRQRVGLAATILHDPPILILDEPTSGLDPNQIIDVRDLIRRMGDTKTVILSTHILPEVEASCGRALILIDGKLRADGTLAELTRSRTQVVTVSPEDDRAAAALFGDIPEVGTVSHEDAGDGFHTYRLTMKAEHDIGRKVADIAVSQGWPIRELRRDDRSLEQVFRELTETGTEVTA